MEQFNLKFKLIGFQERNVIILNPTIGQIQWPIKFFPDDIQVGQEFDLGIIHKNYQEKQKEIKEALKELL